MINVATLVADMNNLKANFKEHVDKDHQEHDEMFIRLRLVETEFPQKYVQKNDLRNAVIVLASIVAIFEAVFKWVIK